MSCSMHARVFLIALCFISFAFIFDSLLAGKLPAQLTPHGLLFSQPNTDLQSRDVPVERDGYASVLLRAILDAPPSREWIVKTVLYWLMFFQWTVVGAIAVRFHLVEQPSLGMFIDVQHLSGHVARLLCATRARLSLFVVEIFTPQVPRVVPPRLLITVSSAGLSPMREGRLRGHVRSPSRVTEIAI